MQLKTTLQRIGPPDHGAMATARHHQDLLAIPRGSLGRLHELCIRLAGITGEPRPVIQDLAVVTMAGDHGVARQGREFFPPGGYPGDGGEFFSRGRRHKCSGPSFQHPINSGGHRGGRTAVGHGYGLG